MKFKINPYVFDKNENVCFGIIIGKNIRNSSTTEEDSSFLEASESLLRSKLHGVNIKEYPPIEIYRHAMRAADINPNKYKNSLEAMGKRIQKGGTLPRINALVDCCNAVSLREMISLGAHDLSDFSNDFEVGLSLAGDRFKAFGAQEFEDVEPGELVFKNGNNVQTLKWLWRQSEHGKIDLESNYIIFQLVGFRGDFFKNLTGAMETIKDLITTRFEGNFESYLLDRSKSSIEF